MKKGLIKFILIALVLLKSMTAFTKDVCENLFDPPRVQTIPSMLGLTQIGYIPTKKNSVHPPSDNQWFEAYYGYNSDRWMFSSRYVDNTEMHDLFNSIGSSESLLAFTYDIYIDRSFKNVKFDRTKFIGDLAKEDTRINELNTTYFKFTLPEKIIATAKLTFSYNSKELLPVEEKVLQAQSIIRGRLPKQTLIEIGRLAKTKDMQLETIFSALSHHILQRQSASGHELLGSVIGHAGPAQVKIYEKLGFKILADEAELGKDQFIISMPVKKFLRLFPPVNSLVTNPSATTFMDEMYYIPSVFKIP